MFSVDIVYDGGSDWYVLNREFVHYVTYGNDELVSGLRHIFNYSLLPCEVCFHDEANNMIICDLCCFSCELLGFLSYGVE